MVSSRSLLAMCAAAMAQNGIVPYDLQISARSALAEQSSTRKPKGSPATKGKRSASLKSRAQKRKAKGKPAQ